MKQLKNVDYSKAEKKEGNESRFYIVGSIRLKDGSLQHKKVINIESNAYPVRILLDHSTMTNYQAQKRDYLLQIKKTIEYNIDEENSSIDLDELQEEITREDEDKHEAIDLDGYECFITDKKGNIIKELTNESPKYTKFRIREYTIDYADENNLIISSIKNTNQEVYQTDFFRFVKNNLQQKNLFDHRKGGTLEYIKIPNKKIKTAIIKRRDNRTGMEDTRLFSIDEMKFISPSFSNINKVKGHNDKLVFEDEITSPKTIDGRNYQTVLTGYINLYGIMACSVYDSRTNNERIFASKSGRLMEQYKKFRDRVKLELNYEFEREKQNEAKMKSIKRKAIKSITGRKNKR